MDNIYDLLKKLNISYSKIEHEPVYNVEEAQKIKDRIEGTGCKNLFLKDKKDKYYLYMLKEDKRADLKGLAKYLECGHLSFADEEELYGCLKIKKGSVTPLAIINDNAKVIIVLDKELKGKVILVHPNTNTITISLKYEDLLRVIDYCKNKYFEI
ncbi:MAG: prolyl-tRNA synthetase associated domain-containing protein [Clostridium sp.]